MTGEASEQDVAPIIPISALTREAAFRRFSEIVRRSDPVPAELREAISKIPARHRAGSTSGGREEREAELVYDSDEDGEALVGVRSISGGTRRLSFESDGIAIEVEITSGGKRSLICQVVPAQPAVLEVRAAAGVSRRLEDVKGTFHLTGLRSGPLSLRCRLEASGAPVLSTTWVRI